MIEILSPGNKSTRHAVHSLLEKATTVLYHQIHLLIVDVFPPGLRDPHGIHAAIWEELDGSEYNSPADRPVTLASYEATEIVRAFVQHVAIGASLVDMPLFLQPRGCVQIPLESTYQTAFAKMPRRWRVVLDPTA